MAPDDDRAAPRDQVHDDPGHLDRLRNDREVGVDGLVQVDEDLRLLRRLVSDHLDRDRVRPTDAQAADVIGSALANRGAVLRAARLVGRDDGRPDHVLAGARHDRAGKRSGRHSLRGEGRRQEQEQAQEQDALLEDLS